MREVAVSPDIENGIDVALGDLRLAEHQLCEFEGLTVFKWSIRQVVVKS